MIHASQLISLVRVVALACTLSSTSSLAIAAEYPERLIKIVVPFSAGGPIDAMARLLAEKLKDALGQPVIVDNRAGASGVIGAREVARSKPDGYTLLFINTGNVLVPAMVKEIDYDPIKDFSFVALTASSPLLFLVPGTVKANGLAEFLDMARAQKSPVTYASAGVGSFGHLSTLLFESKTGLRMDHIPYKGQSAGVNALLAGEVQVAITVPSGSMYDFVRSGRLKLLGVASSQPSDLAPGAPTIGAVVPGYVSETYYGIIGPAGMPPELVKKLHDAISAAVDTVQMHDRFRSVGAEARTTSSQNFRGLMSSEFARWNEVIRSNHIRLD